MSPPVIIFRQSMSEIFNFERYYRIIAFIAGGKELRSPCITALTGFNPT